MTNKSIYAGVKGTVFDVIAETAICVYMEGFGEVVNIPLSHVCASRHEVVRR